MCHAQHAAQYMTNKNGALGGAPDRAKSAING
jgi:hypothetical protein